MDKLRAMNFFCRVVEAKSFAAAAQALQVVPSAVSKVVAALEQELGFRLMNRSTRGFSLTEEGAAYYERCRQILSDIEDAEQEGGNNAVSARGTLRVGMHPGLRFEIFCELGRFLDEHPALKLETLITNSPATVVNDGLDLVLHIGRLSDSALVARHLGWTRTIVCASPEYLALRGEPRHPAELESHRAIIYARRDEASNTRWAFSRGDERITVEVPVHTVLRDGVGLVDAALGGCGIAQPFEIAARHWLRSGRLREILPEWQGERHAIAAVLPSSGRSVPAKARAYLEFVSKLLAVTP